VPESADSRPPEDAPQEVEGTVEPGIELAEVRALPVVAEARPTELDRLRPVSVPAAVAAATGGFLLGVATFVLVRVLRRPRGSRALRRRATRRNGQKVDIAASRSFLVDVHLLDKR
jgi:hypothetical protein